VGYIVRDVELMQVGDTLIPRQAFSSPPKMKFRRFGGQLEIE
jgi:hypothetical protein